MARIFLDTNLKTASKDDLRALVEDLFHQLEDQINGGTNLVGLIGEDPLPKGVRSRDVVVHFDPETQAIKLGIFNGKEVFYTSPL